METHRLYELFLQHPVITTDTRDCPQGSLFFALKGEHFDGNRFALEALNRGCAYAVVDNVLVAQQDNRCILTEDVLITLQKLASHHRRCLNTPILQITGTNGKTTTKELVACVLQQKYNVLYTQGNLNNHIGVPKTLLRLTPEHEFAVIETGANHPREIAELSNIVAPNCGLITNVGKAHLEGFGSFEGVIRSKSELYEYIRKSNSDRASTKEDSFIFLPNNPYLLPLAADLPNVTYGEKGNDVEGEVVACNPMIQFCWSSPRFNHLSPNIVQTHLIGSYNLDNLLAAVAVGLRFGVSVSAINRALENYQPNNNRSEFRETKNNRLIIDAYNANPSSMQVAIQNFMEIKDKHKMLILGEMRELGEMEDIAHKEVLSWASATDCQHIWLVGTAFARACQHRLLQAKERFHFFENVDHLKEYLLKNPINDRLILIKGSHGTRLFELPDSL